MELKPDRIEIASDIHERDGIGIEVYRKGELVLEIFRDDTKRSRTITNYKKSIPLELMENSIKEFKNKIPWEFIN